MSWLTRIVCGLMCAVPVVLCASPAISRHYLYPTHRVPAAEPAEGTVTLTMTARDGVPVHALELEGPKDAPIIVHFHNNSETASTPLGIGRALRERGFGVLLVEYRGYGLSRGTEPTEEGLYLDAEAALSMLSQRGIAADRVLLWGTSLGTGVAAEMARRGRAGALVLVSPYTSIPDLVTDVAPMVPAGALLPDRFDTLAKAEQIRVPTLVIHGDADEIVPFWMGERLAAEIGGATLLRVKGGHHGDLFAREGARLVEAMASLARGFGPTAAAARGARAEALR